MISRRRVARAIAELLVDNTPQQVAAAAASFMDSQQLRFDHDLLVADVADYVAGYGSLNVSLTTARQLAAETIKQITSDLSARTGAEHVFIEQQVDDQLIGGLRVRGPQLIINDTIIDRLQRLKD